MSKTTKENPNLKLQNATYSVSINIKDRVQFYKLVNWLNANVGKGSDKWTMSGRPLNAIKGGKVASTKIYIFSTNFDEESLLYLSLI